MELLKLILRNTLRHKLRSLLTVLGIAVAVMAFMLLRTVVTAWHAGVEASAANRIITRHAVSFVFPLPYAYRDRIARVPGVERVTYAVWFSGVYIDKNQFFARFAVDTDTFFEVAPVKHHARRVGRLVARPVNAAHDEFPSARENISFERHDVADF